MLLPLRDREVDMAMVRTDQGAAQGSAHLSARLIDGLINDTASHGGD